MARTGTPGTLSEAKGRCPGDSVLGPLKSRSEPRRGETGLSLASCLLAIRPRNQRLFLFSGAGATVLASMQAGQWALAGWQCSAHFMGAAREAQGG